MKPKKIISQAEEDRRSAFDRERDEAYLSLDKDRIVAQLVFEREHKLAIQSLTDEKGFWAGVHAIRLTAMSLDAQARKVSIDWMRKNGYSEWLKAKGIKAK
jgi:hypothetical protein